MKKILIIIAVLVLPLSLLILADEEEKAPKEELETSSAKISYALGMEIGAYLKELPRDIDLTVFIRGLEDTFKGKELLLTQQQAKVITMEFRRETDAQHMRNGREGAEKNRKEGKMFLEDNKKKEGVVVTASGLQYAVLKQGDGPKPKVTDVVSVHYRGTLTDGKEFDSSHKRGKPASFPVNRVIPGWTEALQFMPVGSKYRLFIPSNLAYGERGSGQSIGPNATLIFEVELLAIQK